MRRRCVGDLWHRAGNTEGAVALYEDSLAILRELTTTCEEDRLRVRAARRAVA